MIFRVQRLRTTHMQWTIGEFTYAYMRVMQASEEQRFLIANATVNQFSIYLPQRDIKLPVEGGSVPLRISVSHPFELEPKDMPKSVVLALADEVFRGTSQELADECPERATCLCHGGAGVIARCGSALSVRGNAEFTIAGMICSS